MKRLFFYAFLIIFHAFISQDALGRQIPREMRGVWVSTVFNIDWPSRAGLDARAQQAEAIAILEQAQSLGLNTVFLQVRPSGDAIYPSALVPWTRFLSGRQGQPPSPFYDPLQFWIDEAHKRGLELHAWINPFRATTGANDQLDVMHAMVRRPDWVVQYGNLNYFDPGLPEVRQHLLEVVTDLITRYDIDGLHIDDYFYPYPILGTEFPDTFSFARFGTGNPEDRNHWRRENINRTIETIHQTISRNKPWVKFGVSPFGVWRNKSSHPMGSDTRAGIESYDHLFADVLLWERKGWVDYVIPQLYWDKADTRANFLVLLNWWHQNIRKRHLYIGHSIFKVNPEEEHWGNPAEVPNQIRAIRRLNRPSGSVFFSQRHFNRTDLSGLTDSLSRDLFRLPALTPNMPWIDNTPPPPITNLKYQHGEISWEAVAVQNPFQEVRRFIIHLEPVGRRARAKGPVWFITGETRFMLPRRPLLSRTRFHLSVMPVDRLNNVGPINALYRIYY